MPLQTRLSALITAIGTDIKSLNTQMAGKLGTTAKAADSDKLNGLTAASYLLTTGKAADSNLLDGIDSLGFIRKDVDIIDGGTP